MNYRRSAELLNWKGRNKPRSTGLQTATHTEDRYPGWVAEVRKKPGADTPTPYQTPGDLKKGMTTDEHNAALGAELGVKDVIRPAGLSSTTPSLTGAPNPSPVHGQ